MNIGRAAWDVSLIEIDAAAKLKRAIVVHDGQSGHRLVAERRVRQSKIHRQVRCDLEIIHHRDVIVWNVSPCGKTIVAETFE